MTFGSSRANIGEFDSESSSTSLPRELQEVLSLRRQLWASGYRPVAVYSPSAQVVSAGKRPMGDRWQERARANPPEAATILPQPIGLNTGILCDGLRAIDIDIDDPSLAEGIERLAAQKLGCAPVRWRADSPRCLLLYRAAEGLPPKRQRKGEAGKIEVLGCGQQFVAYGTHPGGQIYQWRPADPAPWSRDGLPAITEAQLDGFLEATAALLGDNPSAQENATSYSDARHQHHGTNGPDATERERAYAIKALEAEVAN